MGYQSSRVIAATLARELGSANNVFNYRPRRNPLMNKELNSLEPTRLWHHFQALNAIPRASKNEGQVTQFMLDFGKSLSLDTTSDRVGNVIIRKPATSGRDDRPTVVLQSHLDMVHQKNADIDFDFASEGIRMVVDGDWVRAQGTTLGADNGIGVAAIMAVLESTDLAHPPLEALFTIDEETGMTGAKALQPGMLTGSVLLNLDTEDDDELTIGCAGGIDVLVRHDYTPAPTPSGAVAVEIHVRGLTGGHSGMDIHLGRGNANKLMNRLLWNASARFDASIAAIDGGGLRNAIPRESMAVVLIPESRQSEFQSWLEQESNVLRAEYHTTDPGLEISSKPAETAPESVVPEELQRTLLAVMANCLSGIARMSPDVPGLVQTSNNLARVLVSDGKLSIDCLTRSSVNSERDAVADALKAGFELTGAAVRFEGDYPGWEPVPGSGIVKLMATVYRQMFDAEPKVAACHAGLECGIIGSHYPGMEMVSFGPNIRGAHSPDEKVQISSVARFWRLFAKVLEEIPAA